MDINRQDNRRPSVGESCDRIILYVDDFASGQEVHNRAKDVVRASSAEPRMDYRCSLYPSSCPISLYPESLGFHLDDRSALYPPQSAERLPSVHLQLGSQISTPRRSRCNLDVDQRSSRRSSVQSSRSRTNSYSRPTPLGDDRRASVSKKTRPRRASAMVPRKDSVRPAKADDLKGTPVLAKNARELEQARRHRRIAMIVLGTFIFLLTASVLVVVITLTHSTFLSPTTGSKELIEHRQRNSSSLTTK